MTDRIERLHVADYEELIQFLNRVFRMPDDHGFPQLLPALYEPTEKKMRPHLAVRREGRIAAVVGLYPIRWCAGEEELPLTGIGAVSVAPEHRRSGLMKLLMLEAIDEIKRMGSALSYLGGRRQRYGYFGWEVAGCSTEFRFNADNFRHTFGNSRQQLVARASTDADVPVLQRLHDSQPGACKRRMEDFGRFLRHWHGRPLAIADLKGTIVGYAAVRFNDGWVHELTVSEETSTLEAVRAIATFCRSEDLKIPVPPLRSDLIRDLAAAAEGYSVYPSGNWRVFDWPRTITALLRAKRRAAPLPEGTALLAIDGDTLAIRVKGDETVCEPINRRADLALGSLDATRLLFGPLPPAHVSTLPRQASMLAAWCPLPLGISRLDHV